LLCSLGRIDAIFDSRINQKCQNGTPQGSDPVDVDVFSHGMPLAACEEDGGQDGVEHAAGNSHDRKDDGANQNADD